MQKEHKRGSSMYRSCHKAPTLIRPSKAEVSKIILELTRDNVAALAAAHPAAFRAQGFRCQGAGFPGKPRKKELGDCKEPLNRPDKWPLLLPIAHPGFRGCGEM